MAANLLNKLLVYQKSTIASSDPFGSNEGTTFPAESSQTTMSVVPLKMSLPSTFP